MSEITSTDPADRPARKQRSDGERSRNAILLEATKLATVEGIRGLSISRLADAVGMSKSGLFAHFGSKEELQLATIDAAAVVFDEYVVTPALALDDPLDRLNALCERFLAHVEGSVFPGGCFFASAAAELDTRPGPVRERVAHVVVEWTTLIEKQIADAQADGRIRADEDVEQLGFEIDALLLLANAQFLMMGNDPAPLDRARHGIAHRLEHAQAA
jgi:AcrR family transcriptional regulator